MKVLIRGNITVTAMLIRMLKGDFNVCLTLLIDGIVRGCVLCKLSELSNKIAGLQDFGVNITIKDQFSICRDVNEKYEDLEIVPNFSTLGWTRDDNGKVFGYSASKIITSEGNVINLPTKLTQQGDIDKQVAALREMFGNNTVGKIKLQAILSIALSSVLCGLMGETILASIVGNSSSGKTTAAMLGVSLFGEPRNSYTSFSFNATENFLVQSMANNFGVPVLIDDTSLSNAKSYEKMIYQLADGISRGRLNKENNTQQRERWATSILMTAETSLLSGANPNLKGIIGRLIEIDVDECELFESAEECEKISRLSTQNYGLVGIAFVTYILTSDTLANINSLYDDELTKVRSITDSHSSLVQRICKKIAIITLAAHICNMAFDMKLNVEAIRTLLVSISQENIVEFLSESNIHIRFREVYRDFYAELAGNSKDPAVIDPPDFKNASLKCVQKLKLKSISEWKELLKRNKCLVVNDAKYGFRTASARGYKILPLEEDDNV